MNCEAEEELLRRIQPRKRQAAAFQRRVEAFLQSLPEKGEEGFQALSPAHHPGERDLRRLMLGELPREEALGVVRHLLSGCRECLSTARHYWRLGEWPPSVKADLLELAALVRPRRVHDEPGLI